MSNDELHLKMTSTMFLKMASQRKEHVINVNECCQIHQIFVCFTPWSPFGYIAVLPQVFVTLSRLEPPNPLIVLKTMKTNFEV